MMSQSAQQDNFKLIKGIGTTAERRLRKAGIDSFESLAKQTPEALGNLLGYPPSKQIAMQGWIQEAKRFASKQKKKRPRKSASIAASHRQRYATFTLEILLDNSNRVRRTQVVHVQSGEEKHWASWDYEGLVNYFIQKAKIKMPPAARAKSQLDTKLAAPSTIPPENPQDQVQPISVSISEVRVTPQASSIQMQCSFHLSAEETGGFSIEKSRFIVEVLALNLLTSQAILLTSCEGVLEPDQLEYSRAIQFPVPKIGRYLLQTIVLIPDEDATSIHLGPFLTTIP